MKNALVILAGGVGSRFGDKIPKQFIKFNKYNFIEHFIMNINTDFFELGLFAAYGMYKEYSSPPTGSSQVKSIN